MDTEIRGTGTNPSFGRLKSEQPTPDWEKVAVLAKALGVRSSSGLAALAGHLEGSRWSLRDAVRAILHGNAELPGVGPVALAKLCAGLELLNMLAEEGVRTGPLLVALALVDTRLLDHVIVGRGRSVSMAETGDIPVN